MNGRSERVVVIAGSGFSLAAGYPSTNDLTASILAMQTPTVTDVTDKQRELPAIQVVRKALAGYYDTVNFELLLHAVEAMLSAAIAGTGLGISDLLKPVTNAFMETSQRWRCLDDANQLSWLRRVIYQCIFSHVKQSSEATLVPELMQAYAATINSLRQKFTLAWFTLNYDDLLERVSPAMADGFSPFGDDDPEVFVSNAFLNLIRREEYVCHLHGSIFFGYSPEVHGSELVKLRTLDQAQKSYNLLTRPSYAQSREIADPGPLISGLRKADKLISHPYAYFHHALADELVSCQRLLIIGYGGSDFHLNFWIHRLKQYSGPDARIAVVTRSSEQIPTFDQPFANELSYIAGMDINQWLQHQKTPRPTSTSAIAQSLAVFWSGFPLPDDQCESLLEFLSN